MQKILIIIHAPPYGSERCLSALRVATALSGDDILLPRARKPERVGGHGEIIPSVLVVDGAAAAPGRQASTVRRSRRGLHRFCGGRAGVELTSEGLGRP